MPRPPSHPTRLCTLCLVAHSIYPRTHAQSPRLGPLDPPTISPSLRAPPLMPLVRFVPGRYHLDDHCMFGTAEAVLHFWSLDNIYYSSSARAWSGAKQGNVRPGCRYPAVESDNGFIWVADDLARRGVPMPHSTRDLLKERAFVFNPEAWDYVCRRKHTSTHLSLPVDSATFNKLNPKSMLTMVPFGIHAQCKEERFLFNCSGVADGIQNRTDTPRWACSASNTRCFSVRERWRQPGNIKRVKASTVDMRLNSGRAFE